MAQYTDDLAVSLNELSEDKINIIAYDIEGLIYRWFTANHTKTDKINILIEHSNTDGLKDFCHRLAIDNKASSKVPEDSIDKCTIKFLIEVSGSGVDVKQISKSLFPQLFAIREQKTEPHSLNEIQSE